MPKTIWRVETPRTAKDFDNLAGAKKYLREYIKGDIYWVSGNSKRLAYFLSHSRLYTA